LYISFIKRMFHILPDDTGTSAIWVAQRVPDDHITAVANQFVITEIDLADKKNFIASSNIYEVAIRNNLWTPESNVPFNFLRIYGASREREGFACTRRIWRIFTLAAPSLLPTFSAYTDGLGTFGFGSDGSKPYPFSVKVDEPLSVQEIMNMNRDQYEGTPFDMTQGTPAGPYGDPQRWPAMSKWEDEVEGVSFESQNNGLAFQRPISLWRTAYSTVTQSRAYLPDVVGAVTWICMNAPHHGSFLPVYANAPYTPTSLNLGTQCTSACLSQTHVYYITSPHPLTTIHLVISTLRVISQPSVVPFSNARVVCVLFSFFSYPDKFDIYTIGAIMNEQTDIEEDLFEAQEQIEKKALQLLSSSPTPSPTMVPVSAPSKAPTTPVAAPSAVPTVLATYPPSAAPSVKSKGSVVTKAMALSEAAIEREGHIRDSAATFLAKYHDEAASNSKYYVIIMLLSICALSCMSGALNGILFSKYSHKLSDTQRIINYAHYFFFMLTCCHPVVYISETFSRNAVRDPHTENFSDSYAYLGVPRWWFEQIGFWGPPGTPPPDEKEPIPILPINVPTLESPAAYKAAYPKGFYAPYPSTTTQVTSAPADGSGNGKKKGMTSAAKETYLSMIIIFIMGVTIGGAVTALFVRQSRESYLPIR
jgi:Peptidase family C69